MAHGYAKVAGKPMAAMVHGAVGTQHAAMAIYNAYCDRVPILIFAGNPGAVNERRPGVEWFHSVQDGAATVRDFVKWDDYPMSLQHFAESTVRGYVLACAQPPGPVFLTADSKLRKPRLKSVNCANSRSRAWPHPRQPQAIRTRCARRREFWSRPKRPSSLPIAMRAHNRRWTISSGSPSSCRLR